MEKEIQNKKQQENQNDKSQENQNDKSQESQNDKSQEDKASDLFDLIVKEKTGKIKISSKKK